MRLTHLFATDIIDDRSPIPSMYPAPNTQFVASYVLPSKFTPCATPTRFPLLLLLTPAFIHGSIHAVLACRVRPVQLDTPPYLRWCPMMLATWTLHLSVIAACSSCAVPVEKCGRMSDLLKHHRLLPARQRRLEGTLQPVYGRQAPFQVCCWVVPP